MELPSGYQEKSLLALFSPSKDLGRFFKESDHANVDLICRGVGIGVW